MKVAIFILSPMIIRFLTCIRTQGTAGGAVTRLPFGLEFNPVYIGTAPAGSAYEDSILLFLLGWRVRDGAMLCCLTTRGVVLRAYLLNSKNPSSLAGEVSEPRLLITIPHLCLPHPALFG